MLGNRRKKVRILSEFDKVDHNIYIHFCTLHTLTNKNLVSEFDKFGKD